MEQALPGPRRDHGAGDVAGGDDAVIGVARHLQLVELARHHLARARRVGDQHHRAAARARAHQRVAGVREGDDAVVHHAPDVAQQDVVAGGERREMRNQAAARRCVSRCRSRRSSPAASRRGGGRGRALQGLGPHRPRRREQEALAEAHVVVEQIDHHALALDPLGDQVDAEAAEQVGEIGGMDVALRAVAGLSRSWPAP